MSALIHEDCYGRLIQASRRGDLGGIRAALAEQQEPWTFERQADTLTEAFRHGQEGSVCYLKDRGFRFMDNTAGGKALALLCLFHAKAIHRVERWVERSPLVAQWPPPEVPSRMEMAKLSLQRWPPASHHLGEWLEAAFAYLLDEWLRPEGGFQSLSEYIYQLGEGDASSRYNAIQGQSVLATAREILFQVIDRFGLESTPRLPGTFVQMPRMATVPYLADHLAKVEQCFLGWVPVPWVTPKRVLDSAPQS